VCTGLFYGRSERISSSIDESEKLTQLIEENTNFEVKNYYILIEQAIKDNCNVIIAPDGIIGNIIFRTLILVNSWPSCGAITFGINGVYIDTSRDQSVEGYLRSLKFAYKLANL
jgi:predicted methyltransferase MtxX (methanogen marker protein 4)